MPTTDTTTRACVTPGCTRPARPQRRRCNRCLSARRRHGDHLARTSHRLPIRPLLDWIDAQAGEPVPLRQVADILGVHNKQVHRWTRLDLCLDHADRAAIRLGVHPTAIWGDQFWAGTAIDGSVDPATDLLATSPPRPRKTVTAA